MLHRSRRRNENGVKRSQYWVKFSLIKCFYFCVFLAVFTAKNFNINSKNMKSYLRLKKEQRRVCKLCMLR